MEKLFIKGTQGTYFVPEVLLDAQTGVCNIKGESYLENADEFYDQVLDWLDQYYQEQEVARPMIFSFNLSYFNTGSSKALMRIMKKLQHYVDLGHNIKINWYYPSNDLSLASEAEDLRDTAKLKQLNIIPYRIDF